MTDPVMYGQMSSEKVAEENQICRQIVREISLFGVSERQRMLIIYLLSLELENQELLETVTSVVKEIAGDQLFLSGKVEGDKNGSLNI